MKPNAMEAALDTILARIGPAPLLVLFALVMLLPGFTTLPPMDRDEPRFAQASKQMLETGDFVDIRFGDEARNKKPVGIHWMQAAAVRAAELLQVPDARQQIWLYRVPSLFGGILTVLLTYWTALPLVSRRGAVLAGLLMAATPLLGVETRLATTDAVLVMTVTAAMGALARVYLGEIRSRRAAPAIAAVFWVALGVGILVKGPITPMVLGFAAIALSLKQRSARWLLALRPVAGILLCLLLVLPWFVLIALRTHGTFLSDAVGHDLLGKVAGAQEMHGAPPGSYFAAFWLSAWPIAPFVALGAAAMWRHRREPDTAFLLAWLVPAWLVFELVPTKLFHYVLPLYPALAILAVLGLERMASAGRRHRSASGWVLFGLLAIVPLTAMTLIVVGQGPLWALSPAGIALGVVAMLVALALAFLARDAWLGQSLAGASVAAALAALPIYLFVFGALLTPAVSGRLAVSPRLESAAASALGGSCPDPRYATVGDREPSLVFATDAKLLMTDASGAARFLSEGPCRVAFVEARDQPAFTAALDPDLGVQQFSRVEGIAINGGRALDIGVYLRQ